LHLTKAISCTPLSMANKLVCHGCSARLWNKLEIQNRAPEQQWNRIAFVGRLFGNRRPNRTTFCWGCLVQRRATAAAAPRRQPPPSAFVAAGSSTTERRTESLLSNSRTKGHLLGPSVREQAPNRTPFCSAPLLVCLVVQFLCCQELARVTALLIRINELLKV